MKKLTITIVAALIALACNTSEEKSKTIAMAHPQEQNSNDGWITLFNGTDFNHWKGYLKDGMPETWSIDGDAMKFTPNGSRGNNIITKEKYTNFMLSLEWKVSEGGNSGIFWGVFEDEKFPEAYQTGPEIQVLDNDRHPDAKAGTTHQAGALYDMIAPNANVCKPAGEWNTCILTVNHETNEGSVMLNGTEIVKFPVHGPEWDAMVANSKFKTWEGFGKYHTGHIGLQDHGDVVWYRNIKIKPL